MDPQQIAQRLQELETLCRQQGLALTVQRRIVLQTVLERDDHPTADEILADVKERVPGISRTTVYRVLDTLADLGLLRHLHHAGPAARFDGRIHRHHHLICSQCHKVLDVDDKKLDKLRVDHIDLEGFAIDDFSVHMLGVCKACRQARGQRP